jgi:hypothetical protein
MAQYDFEQMTSVGQTFQPPRAGGRKTALPKANKTTAKRRAKPAKVTNARPKRPKRTKSVSPINMRGGGTPMRQGF